MDILVKKLHPDAIIPTQAHSGDAGWDLYASEEAWVASHSVVKVGTGVSFALPDNMFGAIYARSGLATKQGLRPANCVGICDSSYRGEYIVPIYNDSNEAQCIRAGERIAQVIFQRYEPVETKEVDELPESDRGTGGFGSTGK